MRVLEELRRRTPWGKFVPVTLVLAALVLLGGGGASAIVGPPGTTQIVSRPSGTGPVGLGLYNDSNSTNQSVSQDGRFVAFDSRADGLSSEDDDTVVNIFIRDRVAKTTTLVSRASGEHGVAANKSSYNPVISSDGTHVAFESLATNLDPAATTGIYQVYVRDLVGNTTVLVSRVNGPSGAAANGYSEQASISANGSRVAFWSLASNLATLGGGSNNQVYVRDLGANSTVLASRATGAAGAPGNGGGSQRPSISGDGSVVAFESSATNLGDGDANNRSDIHLRNLGTSATLLVSQPTAPGSIGNGNSYNASVNSDGTKIAFESLSSNFDAADTNGTYDIYLRDTSGPSTTLVSRAPGAAGAVGNAQSRNPAISGDGSRVVFESAATNLVAGAAPTYYDDHVFYRDTTAPYTTEVADRADGAAGAIGDLGAYNPAISKDGVNVVFTTYSTNITKPPGDADFQAVDLRDLDLATTSFVPLPNGTTPLDSSRAWSWIGRRSVSGDGRFVAFMSDSNNLSTENDDRWWGVYLRDVLTDTTTLVSRASGTAGAAADLDSDTATISDDGTKVAFVSRADNLVPGDTNGVRDCFVRDRTTDQTTLVSRTSSGALLTKGSSQCVISADGNRVAFVTASAADPADTDALEDVYVRDLTTNQTMFASRADGVSGSGASGFGVDPSLNADGSKVAFYSNGALVAGATTQYEVYVRDLSAGTTVLASRAGGAAGAPGDYSSYSPSLDAAGVRVAFQSYSDNLVADDTNNNQDVFVRDLSANTTVLADRADGAGGAMGTAIAFDPSLSEDGTFVVFESYSALVPGDTNSASDVFVRNLGANTTALLSRSTAGAIGNFNSISSAVSGNGHCVAFRSYATNFDPGAVQSDFGVVYLRTIAGECPNDPPGTTLTSSPPAKTNSRNATFAFTSNDPTASFQCALDGAAFAACGSGQSYAGLADGTHKFQVRAVDPAGNVDATPENASWQVDATAPGTTLTSRPPAKTKSRRATFAFSSDDATAGFQCALDGAAFAACASGQGYARLAEGTHKFQVRAVDPVGNLDATPATASWTIDVTAPKLSVSVPRQKLRRALARGLRLKLRASERATVLARVLYKGRRIGTLRIRLGTTSRTVAIKLQPSKKTQRALRRARSARFVLTLAASDDVGNARTMRRALRLRR